MFEFTKHINYITRLVYNPKQTFIVQDRNIFEKNLQTTVKSLLKSKTI